MQALPLDALVEAGTRVVGDIEALVQSHEVTNVPASVNASLEELRALIEAIRTGGAVDNLNATLASTRRVTRRDRRRRPRAAPRHG